MTPTQFHAYAEQGFNRVPLALQVFADLETPLSAYLKLAQRPYSYLLESVQGGETWGRYSIIGLPCREVVSVRGQRLELRRDGELIETDESGQPLAWIQHYAARFRVPHRNGLPRFTGGLVGYFGYETIAYIEPRLQRDKPDPLGVPDILMMLSEEVVVFDNLHGKLMLIVHGDPSQPDAFEATQARLDELAAQLASPLPAAALNPAPRAVSEADFVSGFTQEGFEAAVGRIKEYILEGDVMQVVLSQRMSTPYSAPPLDLYRALRSLNPSPYMFYIDVGDFHLVGASPEILVRYEDGEVTVRPIAGTRKRGRTTAEDKALEEELLADPKEIAEHLMLIDLGRNDAGRVSKIGTVQVTERMVVERYSHVMHIVSNVLGEARPDVDAYDVLAATFPAGTVSGAPKIRAMEIIGELEPVKRGVYSGAVGYIGWAGNLDTAIAIRTAVIKDGVLYIQAGAGVVQDSVPRSEWEETLNKGRAVFRAVAIAEAGMATPGVRI